jgi:ribosomal-protein-alanine N-acetyltransferase
VLGILRRSAPEQKAPALETPRLVLRPPRMEDWPAWAELRAQSRAFLAPWEPTWPRDALSQAAFRRRLRQQWRERDQGQAHAFFLCERATGALLGGVTLSDIRRGVAQAATLGYWIGARHAHRGYMTEAVTGLLAFAFESQGLHRLEAACLSENEPSRRLLERLGFRREGVARSYLRIDGRWRDHLLYALLEEEWRNRHGQACGRAAE